LTFQNRNMKLVPSVDTGYLYKDRWIDWDESTSSQYRDKNLWESVCARTKEG
jgi:hypothetical protein